MYVEKNTPQCCFQGMKFTLLLSPSDKYVPFINFSHYIKKTNSILLGKGLQLHVD